MTVPHEIELKLHVPANSLRTLERSALLRDHGRLPAETAHQVSVYFDTDDCALWSKGVTLRIRRIGDRHVQTIKCLGSNGAGLFDRPEWECEIDDDVPDLSAARGTALEPLLSKKVRRALKPVFETRVQRTVYPIQLGDSEIELTLDDGRIVAGRRSAPLHEIELELKRGQLADLFRAARMLADDVAVEVAATSKAERGHALLAGVVAAPAKAASVVLAPRTTGQAAFQAIARACLRQLNANVPPLRDGHSEGLHQARVAVRRLRAAISLFSDMLAGGQTQTLGRELKRLIGELGHARELDVFMAQVVRPAAERDRKDAGLARLKGDVERMRQGAFSRAQAAVGSAWFRKLVLDVAGWIEAGDWTRSEDEVVRGRRESPVGPAAAERLRGWWRKIRRRGKGLAKLDPRRRHELRIEAKKLRYASELLADVFPGNKVARRRKQFVRGLQALQDCLGELNDITVHEKLTTELADRRKSGTRRPGEDRLVFTEGRLLGREEARLPSALAAAEKAFNAFTKAKPYWR